MLFISAESVNLVPVTTFVPFFSFKKYSYSYVCMLANSVFLHKNNLVDFECIKFYMFYCTHNYVDTWTVLKTT